jgi:Uma2 family endonuclease
MSVQTVRLRFTVDDYYRMIDLGMIKNVERAEIIEGELIKRMPIGNRHAACVKRLDELLRDELGKTVTYSVQDPITLDQFNEPQPDIALLKRRDDFYGGKTPLAEDVLLLIEVSDSTLDYDRNRKIPLYAKHEISEVWLINLLKGTIEMHYQPLEYSFNIVKVFRRGETVQSEALPNLSLEVDKILG